MVDLHVLGPELTVAPKKGNYKGRSAIRTIQAQKSRCPFPGVIRAIESWSIVALTSARQKTARDEVPEEDRPAGWLSFSFRISDDTECVESMRRDLKLMTEERNELVHHFLPRWQPDFPDKMTGTLAYLNAQREKMLPMHEHPSLLSGDSSHRFFRGQHTKLLIATSKCRKGSIPVEHAALRISYTVPRTRPGETRLTGPRPRGALSGANTARSCCIGQHSTHKECMLHDQD